MCLQHRIDAAQYLQVRTLGALSHTHDWSAKLKSQITCYHEQLLTTLTSGTGMQLPWVLQLLAI